MAVRSLLNVLTESRPNYSEALSLLRHQDLYERNTCLRVIRDNRCSVCTLPLPCEHSTACSRLQPSPPLQPIKHTPRRTSLRGFKVRYRSATSVSYVFTNQRSKSLSLDDHQALKHKKLLTKLEEYQAMKCAREISRIEALHQQEESLRTQAALREQKRMHRAQELKSRILAYETVKLQRQSEKQEALLQSMRKQNQSERKRLRYIRKQVTVTLETTTSGVQTKQ